MRSLWLRWSSLPGCPPVGLRMVDDTPTSITIRYDGVAQTLGEATAAAQKACAAHGKIAQLRDTDVKGG